jgi:hypothetical protein
LFKLLITTLLILFTWSPAASGAPSIIVTDGILHDKERNRDLPYRMYRPEILSRKHPVIIFSHGLGGSREGATYLGQYLGAHDFITVHIQHPGSDRSVWNGEGSDRNSIIHAIKQSLRDPKNAINFSQSSTFFSFSALIEKVKE